MGRQCNPPPFTHTRRGSHTLGVDSTPPIFYGRHTTPGEGRHTKRGQDAMGNTLDEGMLIRRIIVHRTTKLLNGEGSHLTILIEHMDDTDYEVSVNDRKETPEHLTALLAAVGRGADLMIRSLDILRTVGYMDARPLALLGREIIFGLDRVSLELEIMENSDGEINCGISVSGVNQEKIEEIGGVLEGCGIDVV